jgi:hypothetical protein
MLFFYIKYFYEKMTKIIKKEKMTFVRGHWRKVAKRSKPKSKPKSKSKPKGKSKPKSKSKRKIKPTLQTPRESTADDEAFARSLHEEINGPPTTSTTTSTTAVCLERKTVGELREEWFSKFGVNSESGNPYHWKKPKLLKELMY